MPTPTPTVSAEEIQRIAGATSTAVLPDEDGQTFPIPVRVDGRVVILVMYFHVLGPRHRQVVELPYYAMHLDRETGKVLRFWLVTPDELGIRAPLEPVAGAHDDPSVPWQEYVRRRERFLALSPDLWTAFAAGGTRPSPAVAAAAREYLDLFLAIATEAVAPYYPAASPAFFQWLHAVAAP